MKKINFAHIVNPANVPKSSDLYNAQPITFKSLINAKRNSNVDINLYATVFKEDKTIVPNGFICANNLIKSSQDFIDGKECKKKLPLIKEILDNLYDISDATYLIYTNVDIAVMPYFYDVLKAIILQGYDGFIITRRTISDQYKFVEQLPLMYSEIGEQHPGCDCFIIKRELYPYFELENIIIGARYVGLALRTNLSSLAKKYKIFRDLHLTFHLGDDRVWKKENQNAGFNACQIEVIFKKLLKSKKTNKKIINERMKDFKNRIKNNA